MHYKREVNESDWSFEFKSKCKSESAFYKIRVNICNKHNSQVSKNVTSENNFISGQTFHDIFIYYKNSKHIHLKIIKPVRL